MRGRELGTCDEGWRGASVSKVLAFSAIVRSWVWWGTFVIPALGRKADLWAFLARQPSQIGKPWVPVRDLILNNRLDVVTGEMILEVGVQPPQAYAIPCTCTYYTHFPHARTHCAH